MARVVNDTITLMDQNGQFIRTAEISDQGFTVENTKLMLDCAKKDINMLIFDLLFFSDVIKYAEKRNIQITNFDELNKKFISVYVRYRDQYPNKFNRILKEYKKYSRGFGFNFQVVSNFLDHKFDMLAFYLKTDQGLLGMQQVPLVPEVAERFYDITLYQETNCEVQGAILSLYQAKIYYYEYLDRYITEDTVNKITDLERRLAEKKKNYPDEYKFVEEHFAYETNPYQSVCTDPKQFSIYILNKFIQEKDMESLLNIKEIIFETVSLDNITEKDYELIFDKLSGFIAYLGLQDEYYCFLDMKKDYTVIELVNIFAVMFHNFEQTKEYQDLKEEYLGDDRTHD